jgi:hypothetical protein
VIFTYYSQQHKGKLHVQQFVSEPSTQEDYIVTVLPKNMYQLSYTFLLHLRKKESIGICLPSLEGFSFFFCVGVVEHGLSANLLTEYRIMETKYVNIQFNSSLMVSELSNIKSMLLG